MKPLDYFSSMKIFLIVSIAFFVVACSSEVDKCVVSQIEGWRSQQSRLKDTASKLFDNPAQVGDVRTEAEFATEARLICLKATGKH